MRDQVRRLQERWELIADSIIFQYLDSPSSSGSAHVLHEARFAAGSKNLAATQECREFHEKIRVFQETFLIANLLDEILMNYTIPQNLVTPWKNLRIEEIEKSGNEEPLQSIALTCFQVKAGTFGQDGKKMSYVYDKPCCGYWDLYLKWHDEYQVILPRRCIRENSLTTWSFRTGFRTSEQRFARKRRTPCSRCSGSRKSKEPIAG